MSMPISCRLLMLCSGLVLAACAAALGAPPPNDSCANASGVPNAAIPTLQPGVPIAGTTIEATTDQFNFNAIASACDSINFEVYYRFTPAVTGGYTFRVCPTDGAFNANLAVFDTTVDPPSGTVVIGCFNQSYSISGCPAPDASCTGGKSVVAALTGGLTYYIGVGSPRRTGAGTRGTFTLRVDAGGGVGACVLPGDDQICQIQSQGACEISGGAYGGDGTVCTAPSPAPKDSCELAVEAPLGQTLTATNAFADALQDEISTLLGRKDMFVKFTPATTGAYRISTCGSELDTILSVHTGCPATWDNQLIANDDSPDCTPTTASSVSIGLTAGTTYLIRIAGPSTSVAGNFGVRVDPIADPSGLGACCLISGQCVLAPASQCEGLASPAGSTCSAPCPPALGACCSPGICTVVSRLDCEFSRKPNYAGQRPWSAVPAREAARVFLGYGVACSPASCGTTAQGRFFDAYLCEDGAWTAAAGAIGAVNTRSLIAPGIFTLTYAGQFPSLNPAASPIPLGNGISVSTDGNGITAGAGSYINFFGAGPTFLRFDFDRPVLAWSLDVLNGGGDGLIVSTGAAEYDLAFLQALQDNPSTPGATTPGSVGVIEQAPISSITFRIRDGDPQEFWVLSPTVRTVEAPGVCCRGATCSIVGAGVACAGPFTKFVAATACSGGAAGVEACCPADFDKLNGRTIDDIFVFLNAWFAGDAATTDIDASGTRTIDDIFIFLNRWFRGCP